MKGAKYVTILAMSLLVFIFTIVTCAYGAFNTFQGLGRYPAEEKQFVQMTDSTAYFRDAVVQAMVYVTYAGDGDNWSASVTSPDGKTTYWGTITFYSRYNGRHHCFVYPSSYAKCDEPSTIISWPIFVQCSQSGNYQINLYHNDSTNPAPFATVQFTLLPQIKPGKVPVYNQAAYEDAYDNMCHTPKKEDQIPCTTPGSVPYTIREKGCYLTMTNAAMILSYHGVNVDPPTLNAWLKNYKERDNITPNGYNKDGTVNPRAVVEFAARKGVTMAYAPEEPKAAWPGYNSFETDVPGEKPIKTI
ncbi:hypothetical protein [Candidatus Magnetominusculus xianensis]|uniref:Secreted protein n=1 Tax=Candidatus Magnetominusculus xianensis TaxID=1748249 RepID=A0ABR5SC14_9BACT|nr:hypothetical protein [Candidatus Magnetominusculus xianensis]KWT78419.1 hypothetical protein ASN18_2827 [Candidatus Magnetominusculus xianensis]MBF0403154.1 hypothetical protein [Nitrospirota bacterium]